MYGGMEKEGGITRGRPATVIDRPSATANSDLRRSHHTRKTIREVPRKAEPEHLGHTHTGNGGSEAQECQQTEVDGAEWWTEGGPEGRSFKTQEECNRAAQLKREFGGPARKVLLARTPEEKERAAKAKAAVGDSPTEPIYISVEDSDEITAELVTQRTQFWDFSEPRKWVERVPDDLVLKGKDVGTFFVRTTEDPDILTFVWKKKRGAQSALYRNLKLSSNKQITVGKRLNAAGGGFQKTPEVLTFKNLETFIIALVLSPTTRHQLKIFADGTNRDAQFIIPKEYIHTYHMELSNA
tara:strand:+ start:33 stop:923 length:891 start_codon:yes stop_codon:yes gene_type:complete